MRSYALNRNTQQNYSAPGRGFMTGLKQQTDYGQVSDKRRELLPDTEVETKAILHHKGTPVYTQKNQ